MSVFNAKYLSDAEIWSRIDRIVAERDEVQELLAQADIATDPEKMPELARQLYELNKTCLPVEELQSCLIDMKELEELLGENLLIVDDDVDTSAEGESREFRLLYKEYTALCNDKAEQVYRLLLENGHLPEEIEDDTDLEILKFLDYAGAEYAWRLGINIGLNVEESRQRLEMLLWKGLLERVEGNMLENYHRAKDWTKHMNHTYYRISRVGRLYLRQLRREAEQE